MPDRSPERIPCLKLMLRSSDPELDELLETLGYEPIGEIVQKRPHADPKTYVGSGKLLDVAAILKRHARAGGAGQGDEIGQDGDLRTDAIVDSGAESGESPAVGKGRASHRRGERKKGRSASDAPPRTSSRSSRAPIPRLVVDRALTPIQHHNLEQILARQHGLKVDVRDRFLIVLEIFERRALSKEAKLQVELARLNYMTPFVKEWFHAAVSGEHPGFMAGGEYGVEEFLRYIRKRTVSIKRELEASEERGVVERRNLKERGWAVIGLAGYTNAGKSTLFSALSGVGAESDDRMFTTLSPKSAGVTMGTDGRLLPRGRVRLVVEDTIGFIEGMPAKLIEGFRSTLHRIRAADLTVLLVDASDTRSEVERKVRTCLAALGSEGIGELLPVLSKIDLATEEHCAETSKVVSSLVGRTPFALSSVSGAGITLLLEALLSSSPAFTRLDLPLPSAASPSVVSRAAEFMVDYRFSKDDSSPRLSGWCRVELAPKIRGLIGI